MKHIALLSLVLVGALLTGCTMVRINSDDTSTIEHNGGVEEGRNLADRACRKGGQQSAEIISTVNKNPEDPPGTGKQVTTFRCSSAPAKR